MFIKLSILLIEVPLRWGSTVVLAKPSESGNGCNSVIGAGDNSDCVGDRDGLNHSQG